MRSPSSWATWTGPFDDSSGRRRCSEIGEELFEPLDAFPAIRALWWPRFQKIAAGFRRRLRRQRSKDVKQRFLEIGGGVELKLPGLDFRLRGRADRIDLMSSGSLSVIDYKTGQVPSQKQVDALLSPQLPLEAAMIQRGGFKDVPAGLPVGDLLYLQLKGGAEPCSKSAATRKTCGIGGAHRGCLATPGTIDRPLCQGRDRLSLPGPRHARPSDRWPL
jgi:ATP-dependent helicase/nuclease subunit B